jgi:hypothetical protein
VHLAEFIDDWVWLPRHDPCPSFRGPPRVVAPSRHSISNLWPSGLTSLRVTQISNFSNEIDAFKKFVAPARAILGVGAFEVSPTSGWSQIRYKSKWLGWTLVDSSPSKFSYSACSKIYFGRLFWSLECFRSLVCNFIETSKTSSGWWSYDRVVYLIFNG